MADLPEGKVWLQQAPVFQYSKVKTLLARLQELTLKGRLQKKTLQLIECFFLIAFS
jgi:hypothetical protein